MKKARATTLKYESLVMRNRVTDAVIRNDFPGFKEDYLAIHCLIRKYKPGRFMEIGTSTGSGTKVIARALGIKKQSLLKKIFGEVHTDEATLYSIDVPPGTDPKIIYPGKEDGHPDRAGRYCDLPYIQLFGDSQTFDFKPYYPLEGWFIDGKHNYKYAKRDTIQALKSKPRLIIWHDTQIPEVAKAIRDVLEGQKDYQLFFIDNTRIAFAISN